MHHLLELQMSFVAEVLADDAKRDGVGSPLSPPQQLQFTSHTLPILI